MRKYHPDISRGTGGAHRAAEINEAYETLRDPKKRRAYDSACMNDSADDGVRHRGSPGGSGVAPEQNNSFPSSGSVSSKSPGSADTASDSRAGGCLREVMWVGAIVAFLIGALFFVSGFFSDPGSEESRPISLASQDQRIEAASMDQGSGSSETSAWTFSAGTDPMTDVSSQYAQARLVGANFDFDAQIACNSTGTVSYEFSAFDKAGHAAEMRSEFGQGGIFSEGGLTIPFYLRLDRHPYMLMSSPATYNNQVTFDANPYQIAARAKDVLLPKASRILIRFMLRSGEETIEVDQTDPVLKRVVQPCVTHFDRAVAAAKESSEAQEQSNSAQPGADGGAPQSPAGPPAQPECDMDCIKAELRAQGLEVTNAEPIVNDR